MVAELSGFEMVAVDKLVADGDPIVSSWALVARVILGGLDESGKWPLGGGDFGELIMRAEMLSIRRMMETPSPAREEALTRAREAAARLDRERAGKGEGVDP